MNNSTIGKNKKIATGWLMVIACMLVQAIPYCIVANTQALYMYPVMEAKRIYTISIFINIHNWYNSSSINRSVYR
ncbi:MAG: hypothetical protein U0Z74_02385 [Romboutsia timonensis]